MILLNDFKRQWADCGERVLEAVERVGASGWYILGEEVREFEADFARWWGLPHAAGVANGMDAIEIALRALGLKPGEKVVTTPLSAFATTLAVLRVGGIPVFIDTDESGLIDLEQVDAYLKANPDVRFLLPVHLYGHCLDLDRLQALRDRYRLQIVEDCAQSHGARWKGRVCGSVGQFAATSFYPTKNLGAMGDGGAILTADPELDRKARELRDYGQSKKYVHDSLGLNSRLDELQAAILRDAFLPELRRWIETRGRIACKYFGALGGASGIRLMPPAQGSESVWHLFPLRVEVAKRDSVMAKLKAAGVASGVHYPILINDQKAAQGRGEVVGALPRARAIVAEELSIPIHPYLTDGEVEAVGKAVIEAAR